MAELRGLIVDFGGVLTTDVFASFAAFCAERGLDPQTVRDLFRHDEEARGLLVELEEGRLEEAEFERRFADRLGLEPDGLIEGLMARAESDEAMVRAVRAARAAGLRTGLLSNSWGLSRYDPEVLAELFDGVVLSGEEGMRKPAPEIYPLAAERVGLPPEACVYVDDLGFNLKPARAIGMTTVLHRSGEETVGELERLLGVALR